MVGYLFSGPSLHREYYCTIVPSDNVKHALISKLWPNSFQNCHAYVVSVILTINLLIYCEQHSNTKCKVGQLTL